MVKYYIAKKSLIDEGVQIFKNQMLTVKEYQDRIKFGFQSPETCQKFKETFEGPQDVKRSDIRFGDVDRFWSPRKKLPRPKKITREQSIENVIDEYGLTKVLEVLHVTSGRCHFQKHLIAENKPQFLRVIRFESKNQKHDLYRSVSLDTLEYMLEKGYITQEVYNQGICGHYKKSISPFDIDNVTVEELSVFFGGQTELAKIVGVSDRRIRGYIQERIKPKPEWFDKIIEESHYRGKMYSNFASKYGKEG